MGLTAAEKEHYQREGYVIPRFRLSDEQLDELENAAQRAIAASELKGASSPAN